MYHTDTYCVMEKPLESWYFFVMPEPRVALLVRLPASLKVRLSEIAKQERRSLSRQVELLLERCLEHEFKSSTAAPRKSSGPRPR
jgi:hypothetical protein